MHTYVIGDLQGCHSRLQALLAKIDAAESARVAGANPVIVAGQAGEKPTVPADGNVQYIFVGDLVNRGPQSLETLRLLQSMGNQVRTVLGNHDLHLLAAAHGIRKPGRLDTLDPILQAPDRDLLLDWLRHRPLALLHAGHLVVHAGVLPQWSAAQTLDLAAEVEHALQGPHWIDFLRNMYGNHPARWDDGLTGHDRLRCIVNALTRMRRCTSDGTMLLDEKTSRPAATVTEPVTESVTRAATASEGASDGMPSALPFLPWFDVPDRRTADTTVVFGHWSALGLQMRPNLIGVDTGCLWGGALTAVRLEDRALFQVACPQYQAPAIVPPAAPASVATSAAR